MKDYPRLRLSIAESFTTSKFQHTLYRNSELIFFQYRIIIQYCWKICAVRCGI